MGTSLLLEAKLLITLFLLIITLSFTFLPWFATKGLKKGSIWISFCTCLAGGFILGSLFFHFIPEIVVSGGNHSDTHHVHECPFQWGSLAFGMSFFGLLAIDRLLLAHRHCSSDQKEKRRHAAKNDNDSSADYLPSSFEEGAGCHSVNALGGCHVDGLERNSTKVQSLVFVLALSVHSFVEGLAMHSIRTKSQLFSFTLSLLVHKCLEALALGLNIYKAQFEAFHFILLGLVYSLLTPIGILISLSFSSSGIVNSSVYPILTLILNGLAAGSFLFVAIIEMIVPEFHSFSSNSPLKFSVLVGGFLSMAGVSLIPHEHVH